MSDIKIGQISVTLREPPVNTAQVACGHVVCDVGYAAGYRFFTELTKIHAALLAAHTVLADPDRPNNAATAAEMRLAQLLVDLEITKEKP